MDCHFFYPFNSALLSAPLLVLSYNCTHTRIEIRFYLQHAIFLLHADVLYFSYIFTRSALHCSIYHLLLFLHQGLLCNIAIELCFYTQKNIENSMVTKLSGVKNKIGRYPKKTDPESEVALGNVFSTSYMARCSCVLSKVSSTVCGSPCQVYLSRKEHIPAMNYVAF